MAVPAFANVAALLPLDGPNDSTTFTDESSNGLPFAAAGGARISTAQSKFGGASASFNGATDYLTTSAVAALLLGSSDFCLEAWIRPASQHNGKIAGIWSDTSGQGFSYKLWITAAGELRFNHSTTGGNSTGTQSSGLNYPANTWQHVAVTRSGNTIRLFHDGQEVASRVTTDSFYATPSSKIFEVGRDGAGNTNYFNGHQDDLRLTIGEPVYTAPFTPPTSAHSLGNTARVALPSPLAPPQIVGTVVNPYRARVSLPSPLAAPRVLANLTTAQLEALVAVPSPLAPPQVRVLNDFTTLLDNAISSYILRISGTPEVELRISSWQATLQRGRQSFVQAVVPGYTQYGSVIADRVGTETFSVYRVAQAAGQVFEALMASAPLATVRLSEGSYNESAILQGYTDEYTNAPDGTGGMLTGGRLINSTVNGAIRVRADIDWFLRPGQTVQFDSYIFVAEYINFYVLSQGLAYMDVGDRGAG